MGKLEKYLRDLYYNPESPVAYSGINKIWNKAKADGYKISRPEVKAFLDEMARAIVLTPEHWFLLSGTVNSDGRLIVEQHF
jgi:hypothetical protein